MANDIDYLGAVTSILRFDKVLLLFFGFAFLYAFSRGIKKASLRFSEKLPTKKNKILQIATLINFFLILVGGVFVFYYTLRPPREVAIALLGSASVAIGLSLKDLVASLISGITIVADPPFKVGDNIIYKGFLGEVTHIGLRAVRILNSDQQVITIPNASFMGDVVIAQNPGKSHINVITPFYMHIIANHT